MIVIDINSGLGNQMLAYCVVLSMQKANPQHKIYVETMIYDIPECNEVVKQWNGYELNRIFGINAPNIRSLFTDEQWKQVMEEIQESGFWNKRWNYPPVFTKALNNAGLHLVNKKGDYNDPNSYTYIKKTTLIKKIRIFFLNKTGLGGWVKAYLKRRLSEKLKFSGSHPERLYFNAGNEDVFTGMWLDFKFNGNRIEEIRDDILKTFVFPNFEDEKNINMAQVLDSTESVFIHARMGDMMSTNGWLYKYGYFKRATKHIKKNVKEPLFVFFTNTGSIEWCKEHYKDIFGLSDKDKIMFVDWNGGDQSFRDMQLMTHCKHGIITNSTFGWWGAYLIQNSNKITISPDPEINTTYHC